MIDSVRNARKINSGLLVSASFVESCMYQASRQFQLYVNKKCIKCENPREDGNKEFWCKSCTEKQRQSHCRRLTV